MNPFASSAASFSETTSNYTGSARQSSYTSSKHLLTTPPRLVESSQSQAAAHSLMIDALGWNQTPQTRQMREYAF
jgi:hypothetical protein